MENYTEFVTIKERFTSYFKYDQPLKFACYSEGMFVYTVRKGRYLHQICIINKCDMFDEMTIGEMYLSTEIGFIDYIIYDTITKTNKVVARYTKEQINVN